MFCFSPHNTDIVLVIWVCSRYTRLVVLRIDPTTECNPHEYRRLKQDLSDRKQEVAWLRDECSSVKDELETKTRQHNQELTSYSARLSRATAELGETRAAHADIVTKLRRTHAAREQELLGRIGQLAKELQTTRGHALESTLQLLDMDQL
jgi:predicted RNase H-like nuclease (RuvC/YqgF family)